MINPLFTIVNIQRNEEKHLPILAKSLKEFLFRGGIWVSLDTGSTDNSVQVAKESGATVYEVGDKFRRVIDNDLADKINSRFSVDNESLIVKPGDTFFDFASARNEAASHSPTDMVSFADSDEGFTTLDIDTINDLISQGADQFEYNFCFSHTPTGAPAIEFIQSKFYNKSKMCWKGVIHEYLDLFPGQSASRHMLDKSTIYLEHWQNHETNRSGYLRGLAVDCFKHPENDRNSHYFARELFWTDKPKSAIKEFTRHIEMNRWPTEAAQSMLFMGDCYLKIGEDKEALSWYHKAFVHDASRREPFLRLAQYYFTKNDYQRVLCYAQAALQIPNGYFYSNNQENYTNKPHEYLYISLWWLGKKEESREHFEKCIAYQPNNPKYLHDKQFYTNNSVSFTPATQPKDSPHVYKDQGLEGWMTINELNWLYNKSKQGGLILELGSWKGRSTHALCSGGAEITAVDTWQGSIDPRDLTNDMAKKEDIFKVFEKNVGHFTNLTYNRKTGLEAVKDYPDGFFDVVFIDAGHTYEEVKEDIKAWLPKVKKTGMLCGHDYMPSWMGVIKAVDEAFGKPDEVCDTIWSVDLSKREFPTNNTISKKIFSIWLSEDGSMPELIKKCIESQKIPGYEYKLITLENCYKDSQYVKDCISSPHLTKKWCKLSDYLRMHYLYTEGGIYLDADVEILSGKNFDNLLNNEMFVGREKNKSGDQVLGTAVVGSKPGSSFIKWWIDEVEANFKGNDSLCYESSMDILNKGYFSQVHKIEVYDPEYFFPYDHISGNINITPNSITYHHFLKSWVTNDLPKVSIIIPQLGRPSGLQKCLDSIDRLDYPKELIEVIIKVDEPRLGVPTRLKEGVEESTGEYIVFAANDIEFTESSLMDAILECKENNQLFLAFNTGEILPDKGNICEHFIISKSLLPQLDKGEIFSTDMNHVGVDNYLWAQLEKLGLSYRSDKAIIRHNHFSKGAPWDAIYELGWSMVEEDRKILAEKLANY